MAKQKVTLPSGVTIEGEGEDFRKTLEHLGYKEDDGIHYSSSSKGVVLIKEMASNHIQNAICKIYRDWAADLNKKPIPQFIYMLHDGPSTKTMMSLIEELAKRGK